MASMAVVTLTSAPLTLASIISMIEERQAVIYTVTCSLALLSYDYLITVSREVDVVWQGKWGTGKALFLLNRYVPLATIVIELTGFLLWYPPETFCKAWYSLISTLFILCITINQGILAARTWAMWGGTRRMLLFLCSTLMLSLGASAIVVGLNMRNTQVIPNEFIVPQGCLVELPDAKLWASYFPSFLYETLIFSLTAAKAFKEGHVRTGLTPLLSQLIQHGFGYFVVALVLSLLNILVFALAPMALLPLGISIQATLQSILCTRLLLGIRETSRRQSMGTSEFEGLTLAVGNRHA